MGDAMLPRRRPRVLLIDEIDKCDIDLPGDLLHVFERGWYEIPELVRDRKPEVTVQRAGGYKAIVRGGRVECREFPVIVLTSNGEREFAPAFRRRCLQLSLDLPTTDDLTQIATEKLEQELEESTELESKARLADLLTSEAADFVGMRDEKGLLLATDQLLNALYLRLPAQGLSPDAFERVRKIIYEALGDLADG
jgi:MoxR-like ATPase